MENNSFKIGDFLTIISKGRVGTEGADYISANGLKIGDIIKVDKINEINESKKYIWVKGRTYWMRKEHFEQLKNLRYIQRPCICKIDYFTICTKCHGTGILEEIYKDNNNEPIKMPN